MLRCKEMVLPRQHRHIPRSRMWKLRKSDSIRRDDVLEYEHLLGKLATKTLYIQHSKRQ